MGTRDLALAFGVSRAQSVERAEASEPRIIPVHDVLRVARLNAGLEHSDIAAKLCIAKAHLAAIEEGRFGDLPGRPYAIGYLRQIATLLQLDPDMVVERARDDIDFAFAPPRIDVPAVPEHRSFAGLFVAGIIVGILGATAYTYLA